MNLNANFHPVTNTITNDKTALHMIVFFFINCFISTININTNVHQAVFNRCIRSLNDVSAPSNSKKLTQNIPCSVFCSNIVNTICPLFAMRYCTYVCICARLPNWNEHILISTGNQEKCKIILLILICCRRPITDDTFSATWAQGCSSKSTLSSRKPTDMPSKQILNKEKSVVGQQGRATVNTPK